MSHCTVKILSQIEFKSERNLQRLQSCIFVKKNNNAPSFSLDLPEAHQPFETPNIECFAKKVSG